jgi:DNA-binding helix-hairpin-helix protein with protein kinase domain
MKKIKMYTDENFRQHFTVKELARGGQGVLFRTEDPDIVVKLELNRITGEPIEDKDGTNNEKYKNLRRLPIPPNENINITWPIAVLRDKTGYVMRLLNDMISFEKAFNLDGAEPIKNEWLDGLSENYPEMAEKFGQYIATGGVKRRMTAYLKAACCLSKLHALGLVYCDISPNNMFVSSAIGSSNVWLIDADNINFQKVTLSDGYYTPGYGAPEVPMQNGGCTFYSDCFALLVSLFWQVTENHPFKGAMMDGEESDDFEDDNEAKAYGGEFPWIGDANDESNASNAELVPHSLVFGRDMLDLFQAMFTDSGRRIRETRPSMFQITDRLAHAIDETIRCQGCEMDYNFFEKDTCPWCGKVAEAIVTVETFYHVNDMKSERLWRYAAVIYDNGVVTVPKRVVTGVVTDDMDKTVFETHIYSEGKVTVRNLRDFEKVLVSGGEAFFGSYEINKNDFTLIVTEAGIEKIVEFKVMK